MLFQTVRTNREAGVKLFKASIERMISALFADDQSLIKRVLEKSSVSWSK